ncbi:MAG: PH domain-containing protein [Thermoplasmatota archaeon]
MKTYKPPVTRSAKALYGGLCLLLITLGIISYTQDAELFVSIILGLFGILTLFILLIPYRIRYQLTDDSLVCRWIFGEKKIPYDTIEEVKHHDMEITSIRRLGISLIGGRFSSGDVGKFYAMFGGKREGLIILSNSEDLYGGKIYLTPEDEDEFIRELKERTNAVFSLDRIV